jgi:predicted RNA-binding protein Jag
MSYDAKSEPNEFFADSRDEAVAKAARFFGVEEGELRVQEPENVYGLGARSVVVAVPKNVKPRPPSSGGDRDRDRERGRGGRDRERGGRGRDRDRGGRGRDRDRGRREERDEPREEPAKASADPVASTGTAQGDTSTIGEYVLGILERMKLGDFRLSETEEDDFVVIQLEGPAIDKLTEDDRAVGALQLIVNQAAMRTDEEPKRVVLDCDADSDQRESFIERQAGRAAKRAADTGRSVALDPMNGRDRRALHMAVRDIEGVVTMSVGTGRYRQVVIVPEGADEYEEAAAAAKDAEERDSEGDGE